jgi:uncharacterized membrane protein
MSCREQKAYTKGGARDIECVYFELRPKYTNVFISTKSNRMGIIMAKASAANSDDKNATNFLAYLLLWITGIIVYFTKGKTNPRIKFHSIQAILIGAVSAVISIIFGLLALAAFTWIINMLIWLYGLYVGFRAYNGVDVAVPYISEYSYSHSGYKKQTSKAKAAERDSEKPEDSDDAIKALKLRYANGKITKKAYLRMKKELEG